MHCDFDFCQATFCFRRISLHVPLPFTHIIILLISNEDLSKHKLKKLRTFDFVKWMCIYALYERVTRTHCEVDSRSCAIFYPATTSMASLSWMGSGQRPTVSQETQNFRVFFRVAFRLYHNNSHLRFVATQQHINVSISS
jgi:hypothetical protein